MLDDLVGHHLRQDHRQTHARRACQPGPRGLPAPRRSVRPGADRRGPGNAPVREAQRQRLVVRRNEGARPGGASDGHRSGIRPGRRNPDRGVCRGPRNGLRHARRRRQGVCFPDHGDRFEEGFLRLRSQIHRRIFRRNHPCGHHPGGEGRAEPHDPRGVPHLPLFGRRKGRLHRHPRGRALFHRAELDSRHERGKHRSQTGPRMGMSLGELYDIIIADTCRK